MKSTILSCYRKLWLLVVFISINGLVWAQENGGSSSTTSTTTSSTDIKVSTDQADGGNWYASPWVWVLAALGFILLLVALLRGGGSRSTTGTTDRVTVTKTVSRDTDV